MAINSVTPPLHASVTRQRQRSLERIKLNLAYWMRYVRQHGDDVSALDAEREQVIAAISYGFRVQDVWQLVYQLITRFATYMERRGHWDTWQHVLKQAIKTSQQVGNIHETLTLHLLSARLSQRQNRANDTVREYHQIIKLARQQGDLYEKARACTNLGYLFIEKGLWHRAELLCCHALNIAKQIDSHHIQAHTENHLGILYTRQRYWRLAQHHLERAYNLWESNHDQHGMMRGLISLSLLYNEHNRPSDALSYLEQALSYAEILGDYTEIGNIYLNMSSAYLIQNDFVNFKHYTLLSEKIFKRPVNLLKLAMIEVNKGLAYLQQENYELGQKHLTLALQQWRSLQHRYYEVKTLLYLTENALLQGNQNKANTWFNEVQRLNLSDKWFAQNPSLQEIISKYHLNL